MSTFPDTTLYPGQGGTPIVRVRVSFDPVSVTTPSWTEVANADLRRISIQAGREDEFSEFDAAQCDITFDNRDRAFDPRVNISVRPYNRVWVYTEFNGKVRTRFKGYVESWGLSYPGGGWSDAEATAHCADEFKVLAIMALPTTSPPRESYSDLVASDNPAGQWALNEDASSRQRGPEPDPISETRRGVITAQESNRPNKSILNRNRKRRAF